MTPQQVRGLRSRVAIADGRLAQSLHELGKAQAIADGDVAVNAAIDKAFEAIADARAELETLLPHKL